MSASNSKDADGSVERLAINATASEANDFLVETMERIDAADERQQANGRNVVLPWRWLRCLREMRAIERELVAIRSRNAQSAAWQKANR